MLVSPAYILSVFAYILSVFLERRGALLRAVPGNSWRIRAAEALGIWVFAAYWLLKIREMRETQADVHGLRGALVPK